MSNPTTAFAVCVLALCFVAYNSPEFQKRKERRDRFDSLSSAYRIEDKKTEEFLRLRAEDVTNPGYRDSFNASMSRKEAIVSQMESIYYQLP